MSEPTFKKGVYIIRGRKKSVFELTEYTWLHIVKDRSRFYFRDHFEKIVLTLQKPDRILKSPKEKEVVSFEKQFDDFYINNTVLGRAYIYVLVNNSTNRIRTIYTNPTQKRWEQIWPAK